MQKSDLLKAEEVKDAAEENVAKIVPSAVNEEKSKKFAKGSVKEVKAKPTKSPAAKKTQTTRKSGAA